VVSNSSRLDEAEGVRSVVGSSIQSYFEHHGFVEKYRHIQSLGRASRYCNAFFDADGVRYEKRLKLNHKFRLQFSRFYFNPLSDNLLAERLS